MGRKYIHLGEKLWLEDFNSKHLATPSVNACEVCYQGKTMQMSNGKKQNKDKSAKSQMITIKLLRQTEIANLIIIQLKRAAQVKIIWFKTNIFEQSHAV